LPNSRIRYGGSRRSVPAVRASPGVGEEILDFGWLAGDAADITDKALPMASNGAVPGVLILKTHVGAAGAT
jgi:hypothetical protein